MKKLERISFDEQATNNDKLYELKNAFNYVIDSLNDCQFHEICEKCGFPEVKGKKLKNQCVYKSENCEKCPRWCKNCDEAGHPSLGYITEKRCPKCVETNNLTNCSDKKCCNYVEELFTGRMPFDMKTFLNVKLKENADELLRHNAKTIMIIAEAIYKQGVKDGESFEVMSSAIRENKCQ